MSSLDLTTFAGDAWKEPVNWPAAAANKDWEMFDHDMDQVLEAVTAGDVGKKLRAMSSIIWSIGADCFGKKELKARSNTQPKENRCLREIAILRGDLQRLKKAFCEETEDEKPALTEIRYNLRECIKILRRAECRRWDSCRKGWTSRDFRNPFKYLAKRLGDKRSENNKRRRWRSTFVKSTVFWKEGGQFGGDGETNQSS